MSKELKNDKSLDPAKALKDTKIEPGESEFNYPSLGITVKAKDMVEADRKKDEVLKNRSIETK